MSYCSVISASLDYSDRSNVLTQVIQSKQLTANPQCNKAIPNSSHLFTGDKVFRLLRFFLILFCILRAVNCACHTVTGESCIRFNPVTIRSTDIVTDAGQMLPHSGVVIKNLIKFNDSTEFSFYPKAKKGMREMERCCTRE